MKLIVVNDHLVSEEEGVQLLILDPVILRHDRFGSFRLMRRMLSPATLPYVNQQGIIPKIQHQGSLPVKSPPVGLGIASWAQHPPTPPCNGGAPGETDRRKPQTLFQP